MKEKIFETLKTFIITLIVAFIVTNPENFVFNILNKLGYEKNEILKKSILSAVITAIITIVLIFISKFWSNIKKNLTKVDVSIITKINGTKRTTCKFSSNNYEYADQDIEIEIVLNPGGKLSNFLLKRIGLKLNVYFNPEILDVSFYDKWDSDIGGPFRLSERKITIDLLGDIEIKGKNFLESSHKLNEKFKVKPIRVKNNRTALDFEITSEKLGYITRAISRFLLTIDCDPLKVTCKEE
ncbi:MULTISPECIES: hypothetical protein [Bacillus]|uniref:hypothetical protein n=1 Tax=Bacillus TaxID=1386 RepID=UPI001B81FC8E|nr:MULTISPECIES: hypothetical protein [Bacillus]MBR0622134.1 hypothetical protein [Bacillus pumilus]MCW6700282.1 hypothetical protein [Bacillus sp. RP12]